MFKKLYFILSEAALLAASLPVRVQGQVPSQPRAGLAQMQTSQPPFLCRRPLPAPGWCPFSMTHESEAFLVSSSLASSW